MQLRKINEKNMKYNWLSIVGIAVTIFYGFLLYSLIREKLPTLGSMELNNVGDFLAGAFGPLAIFWLVLGFFQQGKELQQSTKALQLQAEELKKSVEQHKELVKTTREQLITDREYLKLEEQKIIREEEKRIRDAEPKLNMVNGVWKSKGGGRIDYSFNFINSGKAISHLKFTSIPSIEAIANHPAIHYLGEGEKLNFPWVWNNGKPPKELKILVKGKDSNKVNYETVFVLSLDSDERYIENNI